MEYMESRMQDLYDAWDHQEEERARFYFGMLALVIFMTQVGNVAQIDRMARFGAK